jgi:hypothetical protein
MKFDINLKNSINTNTHAEDVRAFGDGGGPALQNTGIERDGGITNIFETAAAYATAGDHFVTADGKDLQSVVSGDQRLISINGRQIGITSAYGVEKRLAISGCDDACITSTDTYLTATVKGSGIQVDEYSTAQVLLNTRTTTFTNLAAVLQFFTSLSIIRYQGIKFADSLEFALRLGPQVFILKEATPAQSLTPSFKNSGLLGGSAIVQVIVYGGFLVFAGTSGRVTSFDGSSWRYYNGTGTGAGPYNDGTAMGASGITAMAIFTENSLPYLVLAGTGGKVCSFANGTWNIFSKAGVGLWNNAAVVAADNISSVCSFTSPAGVNYLVIGSISGKLGSYTTAGGWVLYNAGAGLCNNATLLGATTIYGINYILTAGGEAVVVVSGGSVGNGRVGSKRFTGGAWNTKVYTDGSGADNPTNNNTVCGANYITCAINWGANGIIFGSAAGTIGHWYGYAWYNYNGAGGAGVCINNQVVVGNNYIIAMIVFNSTLIVASAQIGNSRLGSWDGTNWKNYDGTGAGTGLYNDAGGYLSGGTYNRFAVYQTQLIAAGTNAALTDHIVNSITVGGIFEPFYVAGAAQRGNLLEGIGTLSYLYTYRYENGYYLINPVGNSSGISYTLNNATLAINILQCSYAVPQIRGGFTRHLVSCIPQTVGATQLYALGYVGYTDFVTYSGTVAYQPNPQTTATAEQYALGLAYADITFSVAASATNRWSYISQLSPVPSGLYMIYQTQNKAAGKESLINAYGKLTSGYGLAPTVPFELRVGLINGIMSFISAAVVDGINVDTMGALLTNVGEFDATYMPDFKDDRILYRYNGVFYYTILSKTLTGNVFQKISDNLYKINTISPLNIISIIDEKLHVGSSDYHGQMIFESTAAPSVTATNVASVLGGSITTNPLAEGIFSNSIDVGDKLCYIANPTAANIAVIGYRIPYGWQSIEEMIATYINDIYAFSTANDGSELVLTDPSNPVYVPDDRLPIAIGFTYADGAVNTKSQTIFLNKNYDGYVIGNEAKGLYVSFQLFGTRYLFDGFTISQATFSGLVLSDITPIAPAVGMTFISATPNQAYFLSSFDNSVYIFNGGRSLSKFQRMSQMPAIIRGIYSTRDNALLLETATSFIWVRDDIVTQNLKSAAQTALRLYDTTGGLVIGNDASTWRYGYAVISGSSVVVPLIWQTSYFGATTNQKSNMTAFDVRLYSPGKTAQLITGRVESFDEKEHYSQTVQWDIKKTDYSSGGYYQLRARPKTQKTLGMGLSLTIPAKSIIVDVIAEYEDDANAITPGRASR